MQHGVLRARRVDAAPVTQQGRRTNAARIDNRDFTVRAQQLNVSMTAAEQLSRDTFQHPIEIGFRCR